MTKSLLAALLVILAIYGGIEAWPLLAGPSLRIDAPVEGASVPDGILTVSGNAARAARLTLDGASIDHEEGGNFSVTLALPRGGSILTLTAVDRFGRQVTVTRDVYVP